MFHEMFDNSQSGDKNGAQILGECAVVMLLRLMGQRLHVRMGVYLPAQIIHILLYLKATTINVLIFLLAFLLIL